MQHQLVKEIIVKVKTYKKNLKTMDHLKWADGERGVLLAQRQEVIDGEEFETLLTRLRRKAEVEVEVEYRPGRGRGAIEWLCRDHYRRSTGQLHRQLRQYQFRTTQHLRDDQTVHFIGEQLQNSNGKNLKKKTLM